MKMIQSCGYRKYRTESNQPAHSACEWIILNVTEATDRMVAESSTQLSAIPRALNWADSGHRLSQLIRPLKN
jgi:hypothetical protein